MTQSTSAEMSLGVSCEVASTLAGLLSNIEDCPDSPKTVIHVEDASDSPKTAFRVESTRVVLETALSLDNTLNAPNIPSPSSSIRTFSPANPTSDARDNSDVPAFALASSDAQDTPKTKCRPSDDPWPVPSLNDPQEVPAPEN